MDQNTFFTLFNSIVATLTIVVFYSVFKAKNVEDLNEAFKTRPVLCEGCSSPWFMKSYLQQHLLRNIVCCLWRDNDRR